MSAGNGCYLCAQCGFLVGVGDWPHCPHGGLYGRDASIHATERVVVYENTQTGEVRVPGRGDRPMHPKLVKAGYERREYTNLAEIRRLEKRKGYVHEATNYNRGSGMFEKDTGART